MYPRGHSEETPAEAPDARTIRDMPTYEYACTKCGQHVEVFQRVSEPPLTECGVCGGPLRKVFHPAGIVFKGSGFYATDSRSKLKSKTESGSKSGSGEGGKDTSSSDAGSRSDAGSKSDGGSKPDGGSASTSSSTGGEKAS